MNVTRFKILSAKSIEELEKKMNEANAYEAINLSSGPEGSAHPYMALMRFIPVK